MNTGIVGSEREAWKTDWAAEWTMVLLVSRVAPEPCLDQPGNQFPTLVDTRGHLGRNEKLVCSGLVRGWELKWREQESCLF